MLRGVNGYRERLRSSEINLSVRAKSIPGESADKMRLISSHNYVYRHEEFCVTGPPMNFPTANEECFWRLEVFQQNACMPKNTDSLFRSGLIIILDIIWKLIWITESVTVPFFFLNKWLLKFKLVINCYNKSLNSHRMLTP